MNKTAKLHGGGTEGEEYVAASAKVMKPAFKLFNIQTFNTGGGSTFNGKQQAGDIWWRLFSPEKIFSVIQGAIDSLS